MYEQRMRMRTCRSSVRYLQAVRIRIAAVGASERTRYRASPSITERTFLCSLTVHRPNTLCSTDYTRYSILFCLLRNFIRPRALREERRKVFLTQSTIDRVRQFSLATKERRLYLCGNFDEEFVSQLTRP